MKYCLKNFKIIVSLLLVMFLFSGCSSRHNLNDLSVVEGVGIDLNDNEITATIQSLNLIKEGSGAEALSGNVTMNTVGTGTTISAAIEDVSKTTSKRLFFGQNKIVVFGMKMAENYLEKNLDYLLRSSNSRSDVIIALAEKEASDIMKSPENKSLVPAQTISNLLRLSEKSGYGANVTTNELLNAYEDKTSDIYLPVLAVKNESCSVSGIAIYNDIRLVKILDENESFGFLFLRNKVEEGLFQLKDDSLGEISINIISSKAKSKAEYKDGKVVFKVKIKTSVMLDEVEHGVTNELSDSDLKHIEKLAEEQIEGLCNEAFSACVKNKSDSLRIGEYLAMYEPKAYSRLSDDWENVLETVELDIDVKCKLSKINENSEGN